MRQFDRPQGFAAAFLYELATFYDVGDTPLNASWDGFEVTLVSELLEHDDPDLFAADVAACLSAAAGVVGQMAETAGRFGMEGRENHH